MSTVTIAILLLAAAGALTAGVFLLLPRGKGRRSDKESVSGNGLPVPLVKAEDAAGAGGYSPSPEELTENPPLTDSPGSRPLDEGPSDLETAVDGKASGDALRQSLTSLLRSGMKVLGRNGRELSAGDILSCVGSDDRVLADGESAPWTDPEPSVRETSGGERLSGAPDGLENSFNGKHKSK